MTRARYVLVIGVIAGLMSHSAARATPGPVTRNPSELLVVEFMPNTGAAARAEALEAHRLELVDSMPGSRFVLAETDGGPPPPSAAGAIVATRTPVVMTALAEPNDPAYGSQWHLPAVQAPQAWDVATGAGVVVAVVDTGVAFSASDLAGTQFTAGYDWVDDDASPDDDNGHGTHVTGTIAQTTGNGIGVAGLAHGATIMPLRALDSSGVGFDYDVAQAIRFAADRGATVINLSLGSDSPSLVLQEAVTYAALRGVTLVAAAGNDSAAQVAYPAAYDEVIAVGSVRFDQSRAPYSNTGPQLDLVAPGGDLSVDQNGDGYGDGILQQSFPAGRVGQWCYCFFQGTSMAAPHVAAAAALIASVGVSDPTAIRAALTSTARDLGSSGHDSTYGHGLIQVFDALTVAQPTPGSTPDAPTPAPPPAPTPEPASVAIAPHDIDDACPEADVPRQQFNDVDTSSPHARAIDCAAWLGITAGAGAHSYVPDGQVNRAQMASFLARLVERAGYALLPGPPDAFTDDDTSVHEQRINQLAAVGIARGGLDRRYDPAGGVSRAAMASFLARTFDLLATEDLPPGADYFDDDDGNTHEEEIDRITAPGFATGTALRTYSPAVVLTRAQMATFLMRTFDALIDAGEAPRPDA